MDQRIVIIGEGPVAPLTANRLRRRLGARAADTAAGTVRTVGAQRPAGTGSAGSVGIVVVARDARRDTEADLLTALGVYGPDTVGPPDGPALHPGIALLGAGLAAVDEERREALLADGTVLGYDVLVAVGQPRVRPAPGVVAVPAGYAGAVGARAHAAADLLTEQVLRSLAGAAAAEVFPERPHSGI
jgi:hypothetical protein